jgi:hypothetical protein
MITVNACRLNRDRIICTYGLIRPGSGPILRPGIGFRLKTEKRHAEHGDQRKSHGSEFSHPTPPDGIFEIHTQKFYQTPKPQESSPPDNFKFSIVLK